MWLRCITSKTVHTLGDNIGWSVPQRGEEVYFNWANGRKFEHSISELASTVYYRSPRPRTKGQKLAIVVSHSAASSPEPSPRPKSSPETTPTIPSPVDNTPNPTVGTDGPLGLLLLTQPPSPPSSLSIKNSASELLIEVDIASGHVQACDQTQAQAKINQQEVPLLAGAEEETNSNASVKGKIKRFAIFLYEKLKFKQILLQPPIIVSCMSVVQFPDAFLSHHQSVHELGRP
ncbi:hypothetical protein K2173_024260 [Erythroxylum novogranatense]|uniref:Uncharacterized protein n=1 Tax=Erythroxylum novogranatense TaxID=1862640 RepID=A0AAV8SUN0_9ROSI|nr:hypothetical protein K2173_024260 [Erythroxylum novogranatense]